MTTIADLIDELGVPRHVIKYAINTLELKPSKTIGRSNLFTKRDAAKVRAFIRTRSRSEGASR